MAQKSPLAKAFLRLKPLDGQTLNVVIETPKGSRNKFNFDEEIGIFKLGGVLPAGAVFPFDFGFVPQTIGDDGDPLDVLVLMDEPAFAGCWVPARLIGAVEAEQTETQNGKSKTDRNDRLIAVAENSRNHTDVISLEQLSENLLAEIEHFFASYNEIKGKQFRVLGRADATRAHKLVQAGVRRAR
jgi:inorganic pyrophosphatase